MNVFKLRFVLPDLISFYYETEITGGNLHIVLDDGNVEDGNIYFCQQEAESANDRLGYLIATILRSFTEEEREYMYNHNWKFV